MSALTAVRETTANDRLFTEAAELRGEPREDPLSWDAAVTAVLLRDLTDAVRDLVDEARQIRNRQVIT